MTIKTFIPILSLFLSTMIHAEDDAPKELSKEFTKPITFKFVNEDGKPINGDFTLHQYKKRNLLEQSSYFKNWHRYLPLDKNGAITIKTFPPVFEFGGTSKDKFYTYWIRSAELDTKKTEYLFTCTPTGAMKFEITEFPKEHYDSLVVEYHKKVIGGFHRVVRGIGIHPNDPEHTIGDLKPGEYFIAIKFDYEDKKPIFKSAPFTIKLKKYTVLPKIRITKEAINQ
ncbi:MAG: hypothetical protein ACSHX6_16675 [Akkermansiaceae bacterium]